MGFDHFAWVFLYLAVGTVLMISLVTAGHAILYKRDPRAAVSWAGIILLVPGFGAIFYFLFGINRITRRAQSLRSRRKPLERSGDPRVCSEEKLLSDLAGPGAHLAPVARVAGRITGRPLLEGNRIAPLVNGEEAYPAMLSAIDGGSKSVSLLSYIFERDSEGEKFVEALIRAKGRGAEVRVLIDDVGSDDQVEHALASAGVRVARFNPVRRPVRSEYLNLRNHRKILVVDGRVGFTGGMNIRRSHLVGTKQPHLEQDIHFRLDGPVVEHLQEAFADDWAFSTGELLLGEAWFPRLEAQGPANARGIPSDPGLEQDALRWVIVAALGCARSRIRIMTPYFLPDSALVAALNVASLRGVAVDILIPRVNDSKIVQWATTAMLWQVLQAGCRVWQVPPPFEHTKLLVVDGAWTLLGSANLDPRSLRLNFEFDVESYCQELAGSLERRIEAKISQSAPVTLKEVDGRWLSIKLRDGLARLFTPYL
ncbi:MAG TPA: phospholipase D-like domain-containing protein [Planctomycetota bacterium]|nr:phospholipase D-like domain-containing protein [Planctomycetota bacterium]